MFKIIFIVLITTVTILAQTTTTMMLTTEPLTHYEVGPPVTFIVCGPDNSNSRNRRCVGPPTTLGPHIETFPMDCGPDNSNSRKRRCAGPPTVTLIMKTTTMMIPETTSSRNICLRKKL